MHTTLLIRILRCALLIELGFQNYTTLGTNKLWSCDSKQKKLGPV